jgi:hypothetical protein
MTSEDVSEPPSRPRRPPKMLGFADEGAPGMSRTNTENSVNDSRTHLAHYPPLPNGAQVVPPRTTSKPATRPSSPITLCEKRPDMPSPRSTTGLGRSPYGQIKTEKELLFAEGDMPSVGLPTSLCGR